MQEKKLCDNKRECPCHSKDCERYGKCCECVVFHREKGNLPVCLRGQKG